MAVEAIFCFLAEARAAAGREVNSGNTGEGCKALKVERETPGWEDWAPTERRKKGQEMWMGSGSVVVPGRKKKKGRKGSGQYKDNQRLALSKPSPQMASAQPRLPLCRGGTVSEAVPSLPAAITIGCHTMPYPTIPYHTMPYHTIPYHA